MRLKLTSHREYSPETGVFEIDSFSYAIHKEMNSSGTIVSSPRAGLVKIVMNAFPTIQILHWVWGYKCIHDGVVSVKRENREKNDIQFYRASCVSLKFHYKADADNVISLTMDIAAEKLSLAGENINNENI